jgi:hypothetical protein
MSSSLGERLKAHWLAQGLTVRPGVTPKAIASFEARYSVLLPNDLREYLQVANGTGRNTNVDDKLFCFWSIEEFTPLTEKYPDATCFEEPSAHFLFADHSINCPAYAIRLHPNRAASSPILAIYSDNRQYESHRVVDSFSAFVEAYFAQGVVL